MSLVPVEPPSPYRREGPVVTVLGEGEFDLRNAKPHPAMDGARKLWRATKTLIKGGTFVAMIGAYPAFVWSAHQVDATPVPAHAETWTSPVAGVAVNLIAREVSGPGWTADKAPWHPAARLTAQPAWQAALMESLSDYLQLVAAETADLEGPDTDLATASRLLRPVSGEAMTPRLIAAAEALTSFDSRAMGAGGSMGSAATPVAALTLFSGWADESSAQLAAQIGADGEVWPASRSDVTAFYRVRAQAHVASSIIEATIAQDSALLADATMRAQLSEVRASWRRIAEQAPLVVSNQDGDGMLLPNHLAAMAWHLEMARSETLALADMLTGAEPDISLAEADRILISPTVAP